MPHRREFGEAAASHLAENVLGRLLLRGVITSEMHNAGCIFRARILAYEAVILGPQRLTKGDARGYSCGGCPDDAFCWCALRQRGFFEVLNYLTERQYRTLYNTILLDREPDSFDQILVCCALRKLAIVFRLTDARKSDVRNAQSRIVA
jgi:hypothetical protein